MEVSLNIELFLIKQSDFRFNLTKVKNHNTLSYCFHCGCILFRFNGM